MNNNELILLRGPCDIQAISCYIKHDKKIVIESAVKGDYFDVLFDLSISLYLKQAATDETIKNKFVDSKVYPDKAIFSGKYSYVVFSILGDGIIGLYENIYDKDKRIAYGSWVLDATKKDGEDFFDDKRKYGGIPSLTREDYHEFSKNWKYIGRSSPQEVVRNIRIFVNRLDKKTKIIFLLGPTNTNRFGETNQALVHGGVEYYFALNDLMNEEFISDKNVFLINPTNFYRRPIHQYQLFFYNSRSISHYPCKTYYLIAKELSKITKGSLKVNKSFYLSQKVRRNLYFIKLIIKRVFLIDR